VQTGKQAHRCGARWLGRSCVVLLGRLLAAAAAAGGRPLLLITSDP